MIIVEIIGGLGNQMFQYAFAKFLSTKGYEVKIDISAFETYKLHGGYQLSQYNIDIETATKDECQLVYNKNLIFKILKKFGIEPKNLVKEKSLLFNETLLNIEDNKYISGYFQSEKYFVSIRDALRKNFLIKKKLTPYTLKIQEQINNMQNSCSIHVRRGDYISNNVSNSIHGSCDLEYYKDAIKLINQTYPNTNYVVFSDDIGWVKENLVIENALYIDNTEKRIPHEDMYLMSLCQNNIIANSSFSWWAAWLNQNETKTVIAPKRWFVNEIMLKQSEDIVPQEWIKI